VRLVLGSLVLVLLSVPISTANTFAVGKSPSASVDAAVLGKQGDDTTAGRTIINAPSDVINAPAAAAKGMKIVRAYGCRDAASIGTALADLWSRTFASGNWYTGSGPRGNSRRFFAVVTRPMKTLTRKCGADYAYEVASHTNTVGITWRALTYVIDRNQ
jgi:hypothetical protein